MTIVSAAEVAEEIFANKEKERLERDANGFWMVWREGGQRPRFKHYNREDARVEAERVAQKHPSCKVYILQTSDRVVAILPEPADFVTSWRNFNND